MNLNFQNILKPNAHIHFIGICGTAMASLAGLMKSKGFQVTGSDQNIYPPMSTQLEKLGIAIQLGYKKENLNPRPDFVIVGNVISKTNPEAQALLESDIPYTSLPRALGEWIIENRDSVVVAGTHGKTTTTSMMATIAHSCQKKAGFMIGGIPENFGVSFHPPEGDTFIIEGDEYDTAFFDKVPKFIYYKPKYVILTSIEYDHADIYRDLEHVKDSFRHLIRLIPKNGILMACAESPVVCDLICEIKKDIQCRIVFYGLQRSSTDTGPERDYELRDREILSGRTHFRVFKNNHSVADVAIKLNGEYNALNALAAYALAAEIGWPTAQILQGLARFKGVKRRQQILGSPQNITVIEDFAHHPTAVKVTLDGLREQYIQKSQKLFALFEPRSATSRRKVFQKEYVNAFEAADFILIAKPFDQSKISEADRFSSSELVYDMQKKGLKAQEMANVDEMVSFVKSEAQAGDVVVIMSNGAFDGIYAKILKALATE